MAAFFLPTNKCPVCACAQVDVFGACGLPCPDGCDPVLLGRRYWFALALENSRCAHYVTEKFWSRLHADALPVVNGGLHGERDYFEIGTRAVQYSTRTGENSTWFSIAMA